MWYFAWILGVGLALAFAVLNGLWHELHLPDEDVKETPDLMAKSKVKTHRI